MRLRNYTGVPLRLEREGQEPLDLPSEGKATVKVHTRLEREVLGVPVVRWDVTAEIDGLPPSEKDTFFVVEPLTMTAVFYLGKRRDVLCPHERVWDPEENVFGCRALRHP